MKESRLTVGKERLGKLAEEELQQAGDDVHILPFVAISTQRHWILHTFNTASYNSDLLLEPGTAVMSTRFSATMIVKARNLSSRVDLHIHSGSTFYN